MGIKRTSLCSFYIFNIFNIFNIWFKDIVMKGKICFDFAFFLVYFKVED